MSIFDGKQATRVTMLPYNIDCTCVYKILCTKQNFMNVSKDGRPWATLVTSSRTGFNGIRRKANCKGSLVCPTEDCPFLKEGKGRNIAHFKHIEKQLVCFVCGEIAESQPCEAQKVWEFPKKYGNEEKLLKVYHYGQHTCTAKKRKM